MLDRKDTERYGPPGFHLAQKEKDYVQHWVLTFLSRSGFKGVFKGGTCLQKAFGLPRYSEDLDFTLDEASEPDFEAISAFLSSVGFSGLDWKRESGDASTSARLRYRGPLYAGTLLSEGTILLEFSKREKIILEAVVATITPPYPDLLPYQLRIADKDEIAAEKIRALMTRSSARDLFDLYFLIRQEANIRKEIVNAKLRYYGMSFEFRQFERNIGKLKVRWGREMTALTTNAPDYKVVSKEVLEVIRKHTA